MITTWRMAVLVIVTLLAGSTFAVEGAPRATKTKYRGAPITLHLRDADLKDVLRAFAQIAEINMAIDPGVSGSVTLDLVDVPWDQALDLVLRQNGLAARVEGRVTSIQPLRH